MTADDNKSSFEVSFKRLEEILEKMSSQAISLDESLVLYEEADGLIRSCGARLSEAERRVETLMKTREGEVILNPDGTPRTEPFSPPQNP